MKEEEKEDTYQEFKDVVNMSPSELEEWLDTEESKSVGADSGDGEAVGHKSGRKIIDIKRTNKDQLTGSQYQHMQKVVGYVNRHLAQKPKSDIEDSKWRYSLMNWGHDPLKKDR
ncbi:hypothetical protein OKW21_001935 [Catalinimonas alkaloidigena]|uniref:DUF3140 domain-containing protein n=1 Tax=Catalinimonas alkaloidigena TaxID=1075417 RepID=UPI0024070505|nr:DUF3140 domain-containing protein [Catalinimonas alkaloidigena]MDF9796672.1 hypothetical protein [Catalinimonas alkaloidigena]